jgi:hypothetical protein
MNYDQRHPGRFLKAGLFGGKPWTLTIDTVVIEGLEKEDGTSKDEALVSFRETKKQLVLNATNDQTISQMFGTDDDKQWTGRQVTFYAERDASGLSDNGLCIRILGSPELKAPKKLAIKLPRRRPVERLVKPTGKHGEETDDVFEEAPVDPGAVTHSLSGTAVYDPHDAEPEEPANVDAADEEFLAETADDGKASRAQLNKVRALIKKSELSEDQWRAYMQEITGSNSVSDLTPQGAELFTEFLSGSDSRLAV